MGCLREIKRGWYSEVQHTNEVTEVEVAPRVTACSAQVVPEVEPSSEGGTAPTTTSTGFIPPQHSNLKYYSLQEIGGTANYLTSAITG